MLKFLGVFWQFMKWWIGLFISIKKKQPIDWNKKVRDMTTIANTALDKEGYKPPPTINDAPNVPVVPTPTPETEKRRGWLRRLIERRRSKPDPTPEPVITPDKFQLW